jgi:hypothetical protein
MSTTHLSASPRDLLDNVGAADDLIDRREAARYAGVSTVTMWRWQTKGVLDPFGNRIRLKRKRRGGQFYTTRQAVDEFFAELDRADEAKYAGAPNPGRPESQVERDTRRQAEIAATAARVQGKLKRRVNRA